MERLVRLRRRGPVRGQAPGRQPGVLGRRAARVRIRRAMSGARTPAADAPQLRTLLLTDLCDSTSVVEKLGDTGAAAFFREHDSFVLELQQRWRGHLI